MSNHSFEGEEADGRMGLMTSYRWRTDPKTVLFMLSRYKFVSRVMAGKLSVLEFGCGDAFGSRLVAETVGGLVCLDKDEQILKSAQPHPKITYLIGSVIDHWYDAIFALDVLEHMTSEEMKECLVSAWTNAPLVLVGMPSLESQEFASPLSKQNHINCLSGEGLRDAMKKHFSEVLLFSMNDEVVHTGFTKMAHYLIAIGIR